MAAMVGTIAGWPVRAGNCNLGSGMFQSPLPVQRLARFQVPVPVVREQDQRGTPTVGAGAAAAAVILAMMRPLYVGTSRRAQSLRCRSSQVKCRAGCSRRSEQQPSRQPSRRTAAKATLGSCLLNAAVVSGAAAPAARAEDGSTLMRQGMTAFKAGKLGESIRLFNEAEENGYPKALLWQRGLSLYYADRFPEGAKQFRRDVEMNPSDTEESIWTMMCEARMVGFNVARKQMLRLAGRDPRPVMRTVYSMFLGEDEDANRAELERLAAKGGQEEFYSALYLGLFAEAKGDAAEAQRWIQKAATSSYGKNSGDYMTDVARMHEKSRGWGGKPASEL